MTISAYIVELLKNYEGIQINTNHMPDGSDKYGLFKSPSRNTRDFTDGSYEITEFYQFNARQASLSSAERNENDEWLEELAYWADDFQYYYNFPEIDKNRTVTGFSITGNPYPMVADDKETMYEMSKSINYFREREEV